MANKSQAVVALSDQEQEKLLDEAKNVVNLQAFQMKRKLDEDRLMDALKYASNMLSEMRTSLLTPKHYYALYMHAFDQLRYLESYLSDAKHGKRMSELYELVQYAGNIVPRLYLLITVGAVYIKTLEAPAKDVLRDLVEMCRGVQHPTRGLFLRTYLSEMMRDKLPDVGNQYEGRGGSVRDSIEFVLSNFTEMNKLWVRMQHQVHSLNKEKRQTDRTELQLLIGKNLSRLSLLDGVDLPAYVELVLPKLLDQLVRCKDQIAQLYLMECLIQVFPDEFHLETLDKILQTCVVLHPDVDVKLIIVSLIDRLANYATSNADQMGADKNIFNTFSTYIAAVVEQRPGMTVDAVLALEVSLLNFSIKCYPDRLDYVDEIYRFVAASLSALRAKQDTSYTKPSSSKLLMRLLSMPLERYASVLTVIRLENYAPLTEFLSPELRAQNAREVAKTAVEKPVPIEEAAQVSRLLLFLAPLIKPLDASAASPSDALDDEDFSEEQNLVGSVVHLFRNENPSSLFEMYRTARDYLVEGGPKRVKHTLVPLIFRTLRLCNLIKLDASIGEDEQRSKGEAALRFAMEMLKVLAKQEALLDQSLRLYLQCALAADNCNLPLLADDCFTQAFSQYEELAKADEQFQAIQIIMASLQRIRCLESDTYDLLIVKASQYSAKLLRKPDRCRAVYLCAHLFWVNANDDSDSAKINAKHVLNCLQKSLKITDQCIDSGTHVQLFVEILNRYLWFFAAKNEHVTVKYLSGLIGLIESNMAQLVSEEGTATAQHYRNTIRYIQLRMEDASTAERYQQVGLGSLGSAPAS